MKEAVPGKGQTLTQLTAWWLATHFVDEAHHLLSVDPDEILEEVPRLADTQSDWRYRSSLVRKSRPLPVECVVRGYLSGSAWKEYSTSGSLAGERLAAGLVEGSAFRLPLFSPATKAQEGHDVNITLAQVEEQLGSTLASELRERSLGLYRRADERARAKGIILADTKFEFGTAPDGTVLLIDEVLTPDSSRFWPEAEYSPGRSQISLDKQPIRNYLDGLDGWDKRPPAPPLPAEVVTATSARYLELFRRLTGVSLAEFVPPHFQGMRSAV